GLVVRYAIDGTLLACQILRDIVNVRQSQSGIPKTLFRAPGRAGSDREMERFPEAYRRYPCPNRRFGRQHSWDWLGAENGRGVDSRIRRAGIINGEHRESEESEDARQPDQRARPKFPKPENGRTGL